MELSATSTTVTGPVGQRLQASTEDAPVLDRPAPLRRLRDSGAGYKYSDSLIYLLIYLLRLGMIFAMTDRNRCDSLTLCLISNENREILTAQ